MPAPTRHRMNLRHFVHLPQLPELLKLCNELDIAFMDSSCSPGGGQEDIYQFILWAEYEPFESGMLARIAPRENGDTDPIVELDALKILQTATLAPSPVKPTEVTITTDDFKNPAILAAKLSSIAPDFRDLHDSIAPGGAWHDPYMQGNPLLYLIMDAARNNFHPNKEITDLDGLLTLLREIKAKAAAWNLTPRAVSRAVALKSIHVAEKYDLETLAKMWDSPDVFNELGYGLINFGVPESELIDLHEGRVTATDLKKKYRILTFDEEMEVDEDDDDLDDGPITDEEIQRLARFAINLGYVPPKYRNQADEKSDQAATGNGQPPTPPTANPTIGGGAPVQIDYLAFLGVDHLDKQMIADTNLIIQRSPVPLYGPDGVGAPIVTRDRVVINGNAATGNAADNFEPVMDDEVDMWFNNKPYALPALAILLRYQAYFGPEEDAEDYNMLMDESNDPTITPANYPAVFDFYESIFGPYKSTPGFDFDTYHNGDDIDPAIPAGAQAYDAEHIRTLLSNNDDENKHRRHNIKEASEKTTLPVDELVEIIIDVLTDRIQNPIQYDRREGNIHDFIHDRAELENAVMNSTRLDPFIAAGNKEIVNLFNYPTCKLETPAAHRYYGAAVMAVRHDSKINDYRDDHKYFINAASHETARHVNNDLDTFDSAIKQEILTEISGLHIDVAVNHSDTVPYIKVNKTMWADLLKLNGINPDKLVATARQEIQQLWGEYVDDGFDQANETEESSADADATETAQTEIWQPTAAEQRAVTALETFARNIATGGEKIENITVNGGYPYPTIEVVDAWLYPEATWRDLEGKDIDGTYAIHVSFYHSGGQQNKYVRLTAEPR